MSFAGYASQTASYVSNSVAHINPTTKGLTGWNKNINLKESKQAFDLRFRQWNF
jgi:hypothetical protein